MNTGKQASKKIARKENGKRQSMVVSVCKFACVCVKGVRGQKVSKSTVGSCLYPQWIVLVNIYIVMFIQLRTPTPSLASAIQTVIKGIWDICVCACVGGGGSMLCVWFMYSVNICRILQQIVVFDLTFMAN